VTGTEKDVMIMTEKKNEYTVVGIYYAHSARIIRLLVRFPGLQRIPVKLHSEPIDGIKTHAVSVSWLGKKLGMIAKERSADLRSRMAAREPMKVGISAFTPAHAELGYYENSIEPRINGFGITRAPDRAVLTVDPSHT
jgi:hypothetical protein